MDKELGIFVTNERNMRHILGITRSAASKGVKVRVFLTWKGSLLTKDECFSELTKLATVSVCADSYKKMGYDPEADIPEGLTSKEMSTQSRHVDIVNECTHYLTL